MHDLFGVACTTSSSSKPPLGASIPGEPRVFMVYVGGFDNYTRRCTEVVQQDHEGFVFG